MSSITLYLIRHEKRLAHGLYDCPLTDSGLISAIYKIAKYNFTKPFNIYCSPLLRTLQTIYPLAQLHNTKIKLDDSLYEYVNNWQSHYAILDDLPKIKPFQENTVFDIIPNKIDKIKEVYTGESKQTKSYILPLFCNYYKELFRIIDKIIINKDTIDKAYKNIIQSLSEPCDLYVLQEIKDALNTLSSGLNVFCEISKKYPIPITQNIVQISKNLNFATLSIDTILIGKNPTDVFLDNVYEIHDCFTIVMGLLSTCVELFEKHDIMNVIDTDYQSLISTRDFCVDRKQETFEQLSSRTKPITIKMLTEEQYQNSIYVSHLSCLNAIIINIIESYCGTIEDTIVKLNEITGKKFVSYEDFCTNNVLNMGSITRVVISEIGINISFDCT